MLETTLFNQKAGQSNMFEKKAAKQSFSLTFNANEHELLERHSTVVGHNIRGLRTTKVDLAEVFLAGETC